MNRDKSVRYRLRGTVDDAERVFIVPLAGGTIGGAGDNAVVVNVRGVSRHHARLVHDPDGLVVEDLGSKNGTFVNEVRIERSAISPGDQIQFGPVHLLLEALDPEDAEIGLALGGGPVAPARSQSTLSQPTLSQPTTHLSRLRPDLVATLAGLVEGFAQRVWAEPRADHGAALNWVVVEAVARAGGLVEWDAHGRPVVIAAAGRLGELPEVGLLKAHEGRGVLWSAEAEGRVAGYVALTAGGHRGLILWGAADVGEPLCLVLRLMASLVALADRRPVVMFQGTGDRLGRLSFPKGYIPGRSPVMVALYDQLAALAPGDISVLLAGETGVGKEPLARALHGSSPRSSGPFVALNCAAIAADQLEAELFGVGSGAATGVAPRLGLFREAHGGTLLLDEVGELPIDLQAKLLRVLQENEVRPIGAGPVAIDVRLVSATNRDLSEQIELGVFRGDLYYRLSGAELAVPPLRLRREDLAGLIGHFVETFAGRLGKSVRGVSLKALRLLEQRSWPGNVRQLENEMQRAVLACPNDGFINSDMLSPEAPRGEGSEHGPPTLEPGSRPLIEQLKDVERYILQQALRSTGGNKSQAAKQLGISRNGLAYRLNRLDMEG